MNHAPKDFRRYDQITLAIGLNLYLSIMEWESDIGCEKEIAFVRITRPQSLLDDFRYDNIPLRDWFPEMSECDDDDAIDLSWRNEADVVELAISKANAYIDNYKEVQ
jgi:hypothetical protein